MPKGQTWKVSLPCTRAEAEALSEDDLFGASTDSTPTIVTREADTQSQCNWAIDVYCNEKPNAQMLRNIAKFAPSTNTKPTLELLRDQDWVTLSQQGLKPLRAGRFYVHTSNSEPLTDPGIKNICIDAGQAFGTGHHETTMGCLESLDRLKRHGHNFRNIIDIGTGTGLLAFAANHLWPSAKLIASDIDQVAVDVSSINAEKNNVARAGRRGAIKFLRSNGLDHRQIQQRQPYDLIIANILAGPLVTLAPQIAAAAAPRTVLLLAGLLQKQKTEVVRAYVLAGFRLRHTKLEHEWPCLTLVKAPRYGRQREPRRIKSPLADDYFGEYLDTDR
jgi:ribosomal protein L11 methyltransferase